jgi:hypothetical protein
MMPIKVLCGCGQKYAFDIEPVNGRMPVPVACPVCGADGTAAANEIIARNLPAPPPTAPVQALRAAAAVAPAAPAPSAPPVEQLRSALKRDSAEWGPGGVGDRWKWWYYVVAGICLGGYDIFQFVDTGLYKWLWQLFLPVFCIFIGVWDFQRKRRKARGN